MPMYSLNNRRPEIADRSRFWIAPTATVVGGVELGLDVSIWFGAVIRGDNELIIVADRTNVQDGAVLHTDPGFPLKIGADVTVGHNAILHGCTVGDGTLIGMGSTVLNGAIIGSECVIGANALITEGTKIPDRSLVLGSPGKVIRSLRTDEMERFRGAAARYTAKIALYRATMLEVDA
ncbi:gamma carbonic anhydrase family protein [Ensifer adhaerens]|uniref:gamma carbonic anhydrase family protein n=1 Tax=Ensifer adhaerens TaxID=106592 RepID=UPI001CBC9BDF|nr:gamma carbonic anhydrase family protein [Ensifer adhaerens]MBZ7924793.1 gamma carbonic anhydrase family protein [Ensifer adhaerens]UAX95986.1 gamma carbonic anhydrase family protein [Ensifer adhaerens]UAY04672.1 gamma carbonic anhydrase family protein [Ensifer adhaerens]UAY10103.1 gamma carbonic anhydrase family protein [Ensifer adhaerens]